MPYPFLADSELSAGESIIDGSDLIGTEEEVNSEEREEQQQED